MVVEGAFVVPLRFLEAVQGVGEQRQALDYGSLDRDRPVHGRYPVLVGQKQVVEDRSPVSLA